MHGLGLAGLVAGVTSITCDFVSGTFVFKFWSRKKQQQKKGASYSINQLRTRVRIP